MNQKAWYSFLLSPVDQKPPSPSVPSSPDFRNVKSLPSSASTLGSTQDITELKHMIEDLKEQLIKLGTHPNEVLKTNEGSKTGEKSEEISPVTAKKLSVSVKDK